MAQPKDKQLINPFYSPSTTDDGNDQYKYAHYKVRTHPYKFLFSLPISIFLADLPRCFLGAPERG